MNFEMSKDLDFHWYHKGVYGTLAEGASTWRAKVKVDTLRKGIFRTVQRVQQKLHVQESSRALKGERGLQYSVSVSLTLVCHEFLTLELTFFWTLYVLVRECV